MTNDSLFRAAFFALFVALAAMRIYFTARVHRSGGRILPDAQAVQREGGRGALFFRVSLFIALLVFLAMYFSGANWIDQFTINLPAWLRWVGVALGVVSVTFWTWAQINLDTQWSAQLQLSQHHHLITTGLYAYIRHPLYAGMIGWCISVTLMTANGLFFGFCALAFAGLLWRVPKEEQMMIDAFGEEYKAYMRRTGRFLPKW